MSNLRKAVIEVLEKYGTAEGARKRKLGLGTPAKATPLGTDGLRGLTRTTGFEPKRWAKPTATPSSTPKRSTPLRYQGYVSIHPETGEVSDRGSERDIPSFPKGHKVMPAWIHQTRVERERANKHSWHDGVEYKKTPDGWKKKEKAE